MFTLFKWKYKPNGNCPIQAEGKFIGYNFYFRSRWSSATIEFYDGDVDYFSAEVGFSKIFLLYETSDSYFAGWLEHGYCKYLVYKGCLMFLIYLFFNKIKRKIKSICKLLRSMR